MNRVFANQLRKGRGILYFAPSERMVVLASGGAVFMAAGLLVAIAASVAVAALLFLHRSMDNGRYDHLEILARRRRLVRVPCWSLCERDDGWQAFPWRRRS